jgi:hypothetical protein
MWLDTWWERASPQRRLDMNMGNLFLLAGLMLPAMSIMLTGPSPSSVLRNMSDGMQVCMCSAIFLGCGMKLHGAVAGRRFWFPKTPLKRSYTYGYSGAPIAAVGCITYGYYILTNTENFWSVLSGIGIPLFGVGVLLQGGLYLLEYRRIDRNERQLRQAAQEEPL